MTLKSLLFFICFSLGAVSAYGQANGKLQIHYMDVGQVDGAVRAGRTERSQVHGELQDHNAYIFNVAHPLQQTVLTVHVAGPNSGVFEKSGRVRDEYCRGDYLFKMTIVSWVDFIAPDRNSLRQDL